MTKLNHEDAIGEAARRWPSLTWSRNGDYLTARYEEDYRTHEMGTELPPDASEEVIEDVKDMICAVLLHRADRRNG